MLGPWLSQHDADRNLAEKFFLPRREFQYRFLANFYFVFSFGALALALAYALAVAWAYAYAFASAQFARHESAPFFSLFPFFTATTDNKEASQQCVL